ncbi:SDR family NAD(P)-dependent oxidoreductase [Subtercola lobariae]|uniref:Oxidoreductase n=1 Tax=Subtercola lobariae TaxID=1588641 RepID=A0A917B965_9MICO|nr:SDR family oxidoreductase [Subtercola lobariae]GGF30924.1 oxidoreductase [Subtercola lobariae]
MTFQTHHGRVAVVTGAAGGFGRAFCVGLAERGADIVAVDIRDSTETIEAVEKLGRRGLSVTANITDPEATAQLGEQIRSTFGRCDILVNNAGTYPNRAFDELDFDLWRSVLSLNLDSQFLMTKAVVGLMKENSWGRIINLTSNSIVLAVAGVTPYLSSKMGIIGFTRGLSTDLAPFGITVNAVGPTFTQTEGMNSKGLPPAALDAVVQKQAIKRPGTTDDVVGTIAFLSSDDAAFITGQTIMADGGLARM